jgi:hypothetical protein
MHDDDEVEILHDPQEADAGFQALLRQVAEEARAEVVLRRQEPVAELQRNDPSILPGHIELLKRQGLCHGQWAAMKRILRERHGITWRSPADMNPDVLFD